MPPMLGIYSCSDTTRRTDGKPPIEYILRWLGSAGSRLLSHPTTNNDPPTTSTTPSTSATSTSATFTFPKFPPHPPAISSSSTSSTSPANKSPSTCMRGAPTTPLSHPHLAGVYWASRNPAIPTVAYQSICMSPAWAGMSMEELRLADYGAGWRFPT
ncbi:hypothetical protein BZA05DRAFT_422995 [Tricharina praecox]|uniref:uncharacterized protein n=1 Tax=Tricharina praecox TaxID=43433 RepID=UPI00221E6635|nr:uncharacterized protein BZA05DRAFT_422995 [Tricharina praecox]KAI5840924.1 hypothetical protein BZA05DRAFT_422995 [Tricharina praecox]